MVVTSSVPRCKGTRRPLAEALLAQAVLSNKTQGYKHHPQLLRFKKCKNPSLQICNYLIAIHGEAVRRGYDFDKTKLGRTGRIERIRVTRGQLDYELSHLKRNLSSGAGDAGNSVGCASKMSPAVSGDCGCAGRVGNNFAAPKRA